MYLKKEWSKDYAKAYVKNILMEQDVESPHKYHLKDLHYQKDGIVFDCGGAEGNFLLEIIDSIKQAVIIECDSSWIEALEKTFAPYRDKVCIYTGKVGDGKMGESLDQIAINTNVWPTLIKMDIEGAEVEALKFGISEIEKKQNELSIFVCLYHNENDEAIIRELLNDRYSLNTNPGYMYYKGSFRRGVLQAKKVNNN